MPRRRSFWIVQAREARVHAAIVAAVLWAIGVVTLLRPGPLDAFGNLKGGDFVHFYALGHVALARDAGGLYDRVALHDRQTALVPASRTEHYDPAYPPQVALLFAPFARAPFLWAFLAWAACIVAIYVLCVHAAWKSIGPSPPDRWLVAWAAAAFPPFWNLVLHGQSSVVPLLAFTAAALAATRGHRFVAGLCLGLLAVKPQFALPVAVVSVVTLQGRMIAGMFVTCAAQVLAAAAVFGSAVWLEYAHVAREMLLRPALIEPRPYQLHSIRALTRLLPEPAGAILWGVASVAVIWMLCRVWRTPAPPLVKFGLMVVASTLVSPHLTVYDATVLFPAALWLGAWVRSERYWSLEYWTVVAFLAPTAWLIGVQASVVLLSVLFFTAASAAVSRPAIADLDM
ncbi:MAG TPA: glycosyltransferase family 87 protein [Vicinamibacterales bacterium]|nr:glycosyltransferase family 87 protein [Vicinamibacterales bacterium]